MASPAASEVKLGFLTAIELAGGGFVGGLLVTNRFGRPLEFQCTTPVRANRTQEILYGPTLRPFLLAELIGRTLLEKAAVKPDLVLTEGEDLLELRSHVDRPVAVVESSPVPRSETSSDAPPRGVTTPFGRQTLRFHAGHAEDGERAARSIEKVPTTTDLGEPFERVREALQETMRAAGRVAP